VLSDALSELEKITAALPLVRGLEASDREMDDLADKATKSFDDLMDLGMNIDSRWASDVFSVASNMLGHAITAKNAKLQKKLKMIELQLKKARLDQTSKTEDETAQTGTGVLLDRNELLQRLLNREDKKS
jgi:phage gp29-like protein